MASRRSLRLRLGALLAAALASLPAASPARAQSPLNGGGLTVEGIVYDSLAGAPMTNATVQLVPARDLAGARTTRTDSAGRWRLEGVPPARYLLGFLHRAWDELGLELPLVGLELSAGAAVPPIALTTPSPARLYARLCEATSDSTGGLIGVVRRADGGAPILGATVVITWTELVIGAAGLRRELRRVPVPTREGVYVACGAPVDAELVASAEAPGWHGGLVEMRTEHAHMMRRDIALGDSASAPRTVLAADGAPARTVARGTARLDGVVRDPEGRPVRDAQVLVHGTTATARTASDGAFALSGLPAGTYTVEARVIGYAPRRRAVDLASERTAHVELRLEQRATQLSATVIMGQRSRTTRDLEEFMERKRRSAAGRFMTADEIQRLAPVNMTDTFRAVPGLTVAPTDAFGYVVLGRGNCEPAVWLDGLLLVDGAATLDEVVRPNQVAAVEIYGNSASVPMQFRSVHADGCGAIVIWTKR